MERIIDTVKRYKNRLQRRLQHKIEGVRAEYGILGVAASAAVLIKLLLFYHFIGVSSNFLLVWMLTLVLTYLLFASFQKKWIPAIIYFLLSLLMFCDVTYSSFFNRYLSVNMLGAAGFLGDITESIKAVLKPWFFLILVDAFMVLGMVIRKMFFQKNGVDDTFILDEEAISEEQGIQDAKVIFEEEGILQTQELILDVSIDELPDGREDTIAVLENDKETEDDTSAQEKISKRAERIARRERKKRTRQWASNHKKPIAGLLILFLLVTNVTGSYLVTSLSNQEIYSFHIKDVVNKITGNSNDDKDHQYSFTDSYLTEKYGPLFGVAEGKNLIVIQIESLQNLVINQTYNGQEITPNLNKLIAGNSIYFDHYYQQLGSGNTSDAEFATNNSIYGTLASFTYKLYYRNYFRGLPVLLKEQGYNTAVYHAHEDRTFWNREKAYPAMGFDTYYGGLLGNEGGMYDMTEWMGWGLTDTEFFKQSMNFLTNMQQPFYSFFITLSNHHPFQMLDKYDFIDLLPADEDTIFGNYLNSAAYTDYALGQFLDSLKEEGLYDNSIIALYGDHMGLPKSDEEIYESVSRFIGKDYDYDTMMNIPFIISIPDSERDLHQTIETTGGQLDFLPTMAYLLGFDTLDTIYLGHNLFTVDEGFVAEQTYMTKGSYISNNIIYEMSRDGVFENGRAWNPKTGEKVPLEDCYEGYLKSMGIVNTSEYILKNDVLRKIYLDQEDTSSVFSLGPQTTTYPDEMVVAGTPNNQLIGSNSLEALDASYNAGYRTMMVDICWTEDKEAVLLSSWKDLPQIYNTKESEEISLERFQRLKRNDELTSMDSIDLIAWMKNHPDVTIVAEPERSADYFMKVMGSYEETLFDRLIAVAKGTVEYTGLYPAVLNINVGDNTVEQILTYLDLNHVPAIIMSKEKAEQEYQTILSNADCICFIKDEDTGLIERYKEDQES